jgi:glycine/D-amino acid oxidase-like deaminating enzyme
MPRIVSAAEQARQIKRDGARHRLAPQMRYGNMTVAEETRTLVHGRAFSVVVRAYESIRNVTQDKPLGFVHRGKKHRRMWNLLRIVRERRARQEAQAQARYEDNRRARSRELRRVVADVGRDEFWRALWEVNHGRFDPR